MTTITFEHVRKQLERNGRQVTVIDDLSLKIASGDIVAILGPSGSGKTTLLKLGAGMLRPDSGRVLYDNQNLHDIPIKERRIGMVFQEHALVPHWLTRRSVGFFLSLRKREHELPERIKRVSQITGIGLDDLLARRPGQLSGGERQRVAVARALARDARVLFFDEPFANIDAKLRAQARVELKRLLREFPVTSVLVTHDQQEAVSLAERIVVLRGGKIEQFGSYQHLHDSPQTLFAATFIGTPTINLFEGRVEDGVWHGENFGGYAIRGDLPARAKVTLGVRADYFTLAPGGTPCVVEKVTPYFAERYQQVDVHLAGERWTMKVGLDRHVEIGATLYCRLDPAGILYFDPKTGQRIG